MAAISHLETKGKVKKKPLLPIMLIIGKNQTKNGTDNVSRQSEQVPKIFLNAENQPIVDNSRSFTITQFKEKVEQHIKHQNLKNDSNSEQYSRSHR